MEIESMVLSEEEQARILSDDVPKEGRGPANDAIILLPNQRARARPVAGMAGASIGVQVADETGVVCTPLNVFYATPPEDDTWVRLTICKSAAHVDRACGALAPDAWLNKS